MIHTNLLLGLHYCVNDADVGLSEMNSQCSDKIVMGHLIF